MTQTIINLGTGGALLNGQNGSTASADTNDALFLDWPGDNAGNYIYVPAVNNNGLAIPNEAAFNFTTDFDLRAHVAPDSWTGADRTLIAQYGVSGNRKFVFRILTGATLNCFISLDGSATSVNRTSTAAISAADKLPLWVRVTYEVDTGAGQYAMIFYTSTNGVTWSQLGTTLTAASVTPFNSNESVTVGRRADVDSNSVPFGGRIYQAQMLNGIDGATVLSVDTSLITTGAATTFTAATGQTVTIDRSTSGRKSVAVVSPVWLFGTDDYMEVADNALLDFTQSEDFTLVTVVRAWGTASALETTATKKGSSGGGAAGYLLGINTSNVTTSRIADGTNQSVVTNGSYSSGVVSVIGFIRDGAAGTMQNFTNNTFAASSSVTMNATAENNVPFRVGRFAIGTNYFNGEVLAVALYRRKLSAAEIASVVSYYENKAA
jgi:hypothetical protein